MSIGSAIQGKILSTVINRVADSEPKTTILGILLAGVVATKIDYSKLLQKDPTEIGNLVAALVVGLLGYYTNHKKVAG